METTLDLQTWKIIDTVVEKDNNDFMVTSCIMLWQLNFRKDKRVPSSILLAQQ